MTIEQLKDFGANVEEGLNRCVNNEALYLRLVGMVPGNASFKELSDAISQNDLEKAFSAAHALKGILANLSLTPLLKPVEEITEKLRAKEATDYGSLLSEIEDKRSILAELCA